MDALSIYKGCEKILGVEGREDYSAWLTTMAVFLLLRQTDRICTLPQRFRSRSMIKRGNLHKKYKTYEIFNLAKLIDFIRDSCFGFYRQGNFTIVQQYLHTTSYL